MPPKCFKCGIDASVGDVAIWEKRNFLWVRDSTSQWEAWKRTWTKLPNAIWSRWDIEACNIYCESCWKNWAQFVKPGRKYALSRSCEEMAIKAGIQFEDCRGSSHTGNPFYCPHCHLYLNHGAPSLERHLFSFHRHTGAVKRKLPQMLQPQSLPLPQTVPQPQMVPSPDVAVAASKPTFFQQMEVLAKKLKEMHKHLNQVKPEETSEAKTQACPKPCGELENSDFELRWEFLAANESHEEWQLMSEEMNDALEKRWAQGWHGDNGTDEFYVQFNGHTYGIDCHCMVQWNVKTGRRRRIRRGGPRPTVKSLQAQMVEKDAQLKEVQSEKQSVLDENATLKSTVARLEREKATLEASMADHGTQMKLQEPWRMNRQLETKVCTELNHWDAAFDVIREALIEACPQDHFGNCNRMRHVSITGLQQICNTTIWKAYEFKRDQVRKDLEGREGVPTVVSNLPSRVCSWAHLDAKINEILVIHGTTEDKTKEIANFGFDGRLASERGLYGQGVYFTDQSCKSLQYSGARHYHDSGCFIIARLILGHPHDATGPMKQIKVEPLVDKDNPSLGRCHSVIAKPGTPTFGAPQVHRELVIFDGAQAYPEMIVHFRCS